jgi:DNA-binding transcriptional LysR family regulator
VVEVADIPNVIDLVRAGFGLAFLGPSTVNDTRRLALRRVRPAPRFTVSLLTPSERPATAAATAFIDLVVETYAGPPPAEKPDRA